MKSNRRYTDEYSVHSMEIMNYFKNNQIGKVDKDAIICSCMDGENIVGISVLQCNPFHPYSYRLNVHVKEEFRRKKIGSNLIKKLKEKYPLPYRVGIDSDNEETIRFLIENGFQLTIRCYLPEFKKADLRKKAILDNAYKIYAMSEISNQQNEDVKRLLHENYIHNHFYDPLREDIDHNRFNDLALSSSSARDSYIILKDRHIIGYLITYENSVTEVEVGYIGRDYCTEDDLTNSFYQVLLKLFEKYRTIAFEVDNVNKQGMEVLSLFSKLPTESWNVYFDGKEDH